VFLHNENRAGFHQCCQQGCQIKSSHFKTSAVVWRVFQTDLEDQANELRNAEDQAKKAMADAARIADELRQEQDHSAQIEKMRRTLESQVFSCHIFRHSPRIFSFFQALCTSVAIGGQHQPFWSNRIHFFFLSIVRWTITLVYRFGNVFFWFTLLFCFRFSFISLISWILAVCGRLKPHCTNHAYL